MGRLHIPGLIDVVRESSAARIDAIARDPRFDRDFRAQGPLLNRMIVRNLRGALALDGVPLPPVAQHGGERPLPAQAALAARLDAAADTGPSASDLVALANYVRGEGRETDAGMLVQRVTGALFDPDYRADPQSWSDARVLAAAPSTLNPLRRMAWAITGRIAKARRRLAAKVGNDPSALHGTGVAIHNLEAALRKLRALYADPEDRGRLTPQAATGTALTAPRQVLRQPVSATQLDGANLARSTLIVLQLEQANARDPGYDTAFMSGNWAECPARRWVPTLLSAVWAKATEAAP